MKTFNLKAAVFTRAHQIARGAMKTKWWKKEGSSKIFAPATTPARLRH